MKLSYTMKFLVVLAFVLGASITADAMHGGIDYNIENVPYMAQLFRVHKDAEGYYMGFCGATILSEHWVLTAAHCIQKDEYLQSIQVRVATNETMRRGIIFNISEIIIHGDYHNETTRWNNDIALIKLEEPIKYGRTSLYITISRDNTPQPGDTIILSGYGYDRDEYQKHLKLGRQTVMSLEECRKMYRKTPVSGVPLQEKLFCTDSKSVDACGGDSGSPAVLNNKLVGVAVEGCESPLPDVYVDVTQHCDWINEKTNMEICK